MAPVAGIIMGSDSDWSTMEGAAHALAEFEVPFEVGVVSAHRTVRKMVDYAESAADRGLQVIIAGAVGAAHLPGMVAALTPLPVIGVPVPLKHLDGMDSLLSIVQMPAGVPVATVSIGGARNAGLLAVRILGAADQQLRARMAAFEFEIKGAFESIPCCLTGTSVPTGAIHYGFKVIGGTFGEAIAADGRAWTRLRDGWSETRPNPSVVATPWRRPSSRRTSSSRAAAAPPGSTNAQIAR